MQCENCPYRDRIIALEKDSERNQKTHKEFFDRFDEFGKGNVGVSKDVEYLVRSVDELKDIVKRLGDQIQDINMKPARKWDNSVKTVVTAGISAIISFIVGRFTGGS